MSTRSGVKKATREGDTSGDTRSTQKETRMSTRRGDAMSTREAYILAMRPQELIRPTSHPVYVHVPRGTSTPGTQPHWPALSAVVFIPFWLGRSRDWRQPIIALRVKFCAQHAALLGATVRQQQSIWRINEMYTLATREELRIIYNV